MSSSSRTPSTSATSTSESLSAAPPDPPGGPGGELPSAPGAQAPSQRGAQAPSKRGVRAPSTRGGEPLRGSRGDRVWFAALVGLSLALYAVTVGYGFVEYDDHRVILGQGELFAQGFGDGLLAILTDHPREEPLVVRDLTWLLDAQLFGFPNPVGFHLGNVLLNALNAGLVFWLLRRVGLGAAAAGLGGLLFAVHPVHVEPVAWAMGRKDLLSTTFALLALGTWIGSEERDGRPRLVGALLATGLFVLGLWSKINLALFPAVLAAASLFLARAGRRRPGWSSVVVPAACLAIAVVTVSWYRSQLVEVGVLGGRGPPASSAQHLSTLLTLIPEQLGMYLAHWFVPWDYAILYDRPSATADNPIWMLLAGALTLALGVGVVVVGGLRAHSAALLAAALGVSLFPYLNVEYIGIYCADRYLYLPSVFAAGLTAQLMTFGLRRRPFGRAAVGALGIAWAAVAGVQLGRSIPAWADDGSLWAYQASVANPTMLGTQMYVGGRVWSVRDEPPSPERAAALEAARREIQAALARYEAQGHRDVPPYVSYTRRNLAELLIWSGQLALEDGDWARALPLFARAHAYGAVHVRSCFGYALALTDRSVALNSAEQGRVAIDQLRRCETEYAGMAGPRFDRALDRLGLVFPELRARIAAARAP